MVKTVLRMTKHNHLPDNVLGWFESKFKHYLNWNKTIEYKLHLNSIWVNTMFQHEYNPVHVHQGTLFTGSIKCYDFKIT